MKASTFGGNYATTGAMTLSAGSIVEYAAAANQTVDASLTYSTLRVSGGGTKTLAGNLPALNSTSATVGAIEVIAGTIDFAGFSANRGTTAPGGTVTVSDGATLKVGGANSFPANYATHSLAASSTVEYSGTNQTVSLEAYGNLTLSSSAGAATKTMPVGLLSVAGDLTAAVGAGTSVSFTAGAAINVSGRVSLGSGTTFNGGGFTHNLGGNWINNGTFNGGSGTVTLSGVGAAISGAGANNFNNLTLIGAGVTAATTTDLVVAGNLSTTGAGTFTHAGGGAGKVTLSGAGKTVSGSGIRFNHLTVSGSISTADSLTIAGNLSASGSLSATAGAVTLSGSGTTLGGAGTIAFYALNVPGSVSTANSFSLSSDLSVSGAFTASAGTMTFSGDSVLSGAANLFNVTLNGVKLRLGAGAVLGIAGGLSLAAGAFDVTTTTPNTVSYNAAGAQTILATTYGNLSLSGGAKSAGGALTVTGDLTINSGATFSPGAFTHSLYGNWSNNGSFSAAGQGAIQLLGGLDSFLAGTTAFNALTVSKSSASSLVTLSNNVSVATVNLTSGEIHTGANTLTITSTRAGNGVILGTITRAHPFNAQTSYAFESPNNTVNFASLTSVSSVTMTVTRGGVADFPFGGAINRQYTVSVSALGAYSATLRLHYEDGELNGNGASTLQLWRNAGTGWAAAGASGNDTSADWAEQNPIADLTGRGTLSNNQNVVRWNGSVSSAWEDANNWTVIQGSASKPPAAGDVVQLGTASFAAQPAINSAAVIKGISFGSAQPVVLSLGAVGSLTTAGNIGGNWSANATHTIAVGAQTLSVGGDLSLSDGTTGHAINLSLGAGSITVSGSLTESGGANITLTGAGALSIGADFNYSGGTLTPGNGTVNYNGAGVQAVAGVAYNHLTFNKTSGTATLAAAATAAGNLSLNGGGSLLVNAPLTVVGDVTIGSGTTLSSGSVTISVGGKWTRAGAFTPGGGTVVFNGGGAQSIANTTFNHVTINKAGGTAALTGNLALNGDLSLTAGTLDLAGFTANRSAAGGTLTLASGVTMQIGNSFPANFNARSLASSSTVEFNGGGAQSISPETYGRLVLSNGAGNAKTLAGATSVAGDLAINGGATLNAGSSSLNVAGNWTNNGAFTPATSTVTLNGAGKILSGATTFNHLTVSGSYSAANDVTVNGTMSVSGNYAAGGTTAVFGGNFLNSGTFTSSGVVTFSGASAQTVSLNSGFTSSGTVNFNGSAAPTLSGLTAPGLRHVNVNNTGGIAPSLGWSVGGNFVVGSGASFVGGAAGHIFFGNFSNNGNVTSSGSLSFAPTNAVTLSLRGGAFTSTGGVTFGGTGQITITGGAPSLQSVTIASTHAAGVTPGTNWTVGGDLNIGAGATFHAGGGLAHTISRNLSVNGVLDGGGSSLTLNGTTSIGGIGDVTFNHLTMSSTGTVTSAADFSVSGNLTNNGSFDGTGFTVNFTGGAASVISGNTAPTPFDALVIAKSSATVTLGVNINSLTALTISGGTLDTSTFTLSQNAAGGTLTIGAGAKLKLVGTSSLPTFGGYSFDASSTVEYAGTGSQSIAAQNYGSLTSSSSGARTLPSSGTVGIAGAFTPGANGYTITGSTIQFNGVGAQTIPAFNYNNLTSSSTGTRTLPSSGIVGVAGAFTPGANPYSVSGSTVNFNGGAQTIPPFTFGNLTTSGSGTKTLGGNITVGGSLNLSAGSLADNGFTATVNGDIANAVTHSGAGQLLLSGGSTNHVLSGSGAFQNLELNDANGALLSLTNLTINGTLKLTSGKISTSTNRVVINPAGNVARTGGYVNGALQKNVATGAASRTFEIGDATVYAPVSLAFNNVTTAGNLTASTTAGDHPDIVNSGIASARSVNRYWSLTNSGVAFNNFSATFNFAAGDLDAGADPANFVVSRKNGGTWSLQSAGARTATSTQATGITSFNDFQVGQASSSVAATTNVLSSSANPSLPGSSVTFTATLTPIPPAGGTPTGSVQFRTNGAAWGGPVTLAGSSASLSTASLPHGIHLVSAEYAGEGTFDGSTNSLLQVINTAPVTRSDHTLGTTQNTAASLSAAKLLRTDSDPDGDPLTITGVSAASVQGGTVTLVNGTLTYTPPTNYAGIDSFTYTVTDGYATVTGTVSVNVASATASTLNIISKSLLPDGNFRIVFAGIPGSTYYLQATTALAPAVWTTIGTNVVNPTSGVATNDDLRATNYPSRFYRTATSP